MLCHWFQLDAVFKFTHRLQQSLGTIRSNLQMRKNWFGIAQETYFNNRVNILWRQIQKNKPGKLLCVYIQFHCNVRNITTMLAIVKPSDAFVTADRLWLNDTVCMSFRQWQCAADIIMAAENDGNDYQVLCTIWSHKTGGYMKLRGFENSVQKPFTLGILSFT